MTPAQKKEMDQFLAKKHEIKYQTIHTVGWTESSAVYENARRWDLCGSGKTKLKAEQDLIQQIGKEHNLSLGAAYLWLNNKIKEDGQPEHSTSERMECTCGCYDYNECSWSIHNYKKEA